jgi:RimJ/RimL family protein N-acetyltransferase
MSQPTIRTKKFILRPLKKEDAISLAKNADNIKISHFLAGHFPSPYLLKDAESFIESNIKENEKDDPRYFTFGIEIDGSVVGTIGINFSKSNFSAEIGYWLGEEFWGKGIMTKVIKEVVKYCFNELKLHRIEAKFLVKNIASKVILEKNKFKQEGILRKAIFKDNKFQDLILMSKVG